MPRSSSSKNNSTANLGFEAKLWLAADRPRSNMDATGGPFYTPQSVVRLLVEMLAPYKGRIYDPCCGSGGMFASPRLYASAAQVVKKRFRAGSVQSEKFVEAHGGKIGDIAIYGQDKPMRRVSRLVSSIEPAG